MTKLKCMIALALGISSPAAAQVARGTAAPPFKTALDSTPPEQLLAYIKRLKFDEREGTRDEQRLPVDCPKSCRFGPLVEIQPEINSHRNQTQDLAASGRIIARFINHDREAYARYNLQGEDTVYWGVARVRSVNQTRSEGRSFFISVRGLRGGRGGVLPGGLVIDEHPGLPPYGDALGRWKSVGGEQVPWNNCKSGGCCHPFPVPE